MIVCFSSQECHSWSSVDQSDRKSEWKHSAIKYIVGIQASANLKQSPNIKKSVQNSPGVFLTVAFNRNELTTKSHTKNYLNSKYTQGKIKVLRGGL